VDSTIAEVKEDVEMAVTEELDDEARRKAEKLAKKEGNAAKKATKSGK